jgi:WD40 repeat protein
MKQLALGSLGFLAVNGVAILTTWVLLSPATLLPSGHAQNQPDQKPSPADKIDPAKAANDRFDAHIKQRVAVLGDRRDRQFLSNHPVAFNPSGNMLATADEKTVRLWVLPSLRQVVALKGHTGEPISSVAFSPDGRMLATGCNRVVLLWRLGGKQPKQVASLGHGVNSLAFSPNGKTLALGCLDRSVRLFAIGEGVPREWDRRKENVGKPLSLAFAADGKTLIAGDGKRAILRWEVHANQLTDRDTLIGPPVDPAGGTSLFSVAYCRTNRRIASGHYGATVVVWNVEGDKAREWKTLRAPLGTLPREYPQLCGAHALAFSPDGKRLAVAYAHGVVQVWDLSGKEPAEETGLSFDRTVWSLAFAPDGRHLATGNRDGTAYILRLSR